MAAAAAQGRLAAEGRFVWEWPDERTGLLLVPITVAGLVPERVGAAL
jgi:hypothetical protein